MRFIHMDIYYKSVRSNNIPASTLKDVLDIEEKFFEFSGDLLLASILNRDELYTFYCKKTKKLIGTVSVKWILDGDNVIIYVGNAAVEPEFQRHNLLGLVTYLSYFKTIWRYPMKNIYFAAFFATPKSYNVTKKNQFRFPRKDYICTDENKRLMKLVADTIAGPGHYEDHKDYILMTVYNKNHFVKSLAADVASSHDGYFETLNPDYASGKQLLTIFKVDLQTFITGQKSIVKFIYNKINLGLIYII